LILAEDSEAALAKARSVINAGLFWFHPRVYEDVFLDYNPAEPAWDLPGELLTAIRTQDKSMIESTSHLVPDEIVPLRVLAGNQDDVLKGLEHIAAAGINHVALFPVTVPGDPIGSSIITQIATFARDILPEICC
jgi:alkanesulfonate monooxygenase SsuD/methylene tetrahydromethanopterin reductase-like flavin-dependent oxidoreductase (luciferase family)